MTKNIDNTNVALIDIEDEMKKSYLDYAMSVIVSRALPDVRDGLKPVHRRIIYAMHEGGYHHNKAFKKSAHVVGYVMGKYHPHGDGPIYQSMVRMAQHFAMRIPLLFGQGNFGSMDGDSAASMRYTEIKMAKIAHELVQNIEQDTVDFRPTYDASSQEPCVLPATFPNLLVNGTSGIAVGMATNIPPHNFSEVIEACCLLIRDPDCDDEQIFDIVKGPDFPTGGIICGTNGILSANRTGRGVVVIRAKTMIEQNNNHESIIVNEIPYQVNKSSLVKKIAYLIANKQIEGITTVRDESDREGTRVVIEIKKGYVADVILNQLYKDTQLQVHFNSNMVALNNNRPELMSLRGILAAFVNFRREVTYKSITFNLNELRNKAHILVGLSVAVDSIDYVIQTIRASKNYNDAKEQLLARKFVAKDLVAVINIIDDQSQKVNQDNSLLLTEKQVKAVLDLRLHKLTNLEMNDLRVELQKLSDSISHLLELLESPKKMDQSIIDYLTELKNKYAIPRITQIADIDLDCNEIDLIQKEDMIVTVTYHGYIKRTPLSAYSSQKRGGKGKSSIDTKDDDFVINVFFANTHDSILLFSESGIAYKLKVYKLPLGTSQSRGKALVNMLDSNATRITTVMSVPESKDENLEGLNILFVTSSGYIRRNKLSDFTRVNNNGKIAMKLSNDEKLVTAILCKDNDDILLATYYGMAIRFNISDLRVFLSRNSLGVRGIKLKNNDKVISASVLSHVNLSTEDRVNYLKGEDSNNNVEFKNKEEFILTVTSAGLGKITSAYEYRITARGGSGISNINLSDKSYVIDSFRVSKNDEIVLISSSGQLIRLAVSDISIYSRRTKGVTLFRKAKEEKVVSVARLTNLEEK